MGARRARTGRYRPHRRRGRPPGYRPAKGTFDLPNRSTPSNGRCGGRRRRWPAVTLRRNRRAGRSTRPSPRQRVQWCDHRPVRRARTVPHPRQVRHLAQGVRVTNVRTPVTAASTATVTPHPVKIVPAVGPMGGVGRCAPSHSVPCTTVDQRERRDRRLDSMIHSTGSVHTGVSAARTPEIGSAWPPAAIR